MALYFRNWTSHHCIYQGNV